MQGPQLGALAAIATAFLVDAVGVGLEIAGKRIGSLAVSFLRLVITVIIFTGLRRLGAPALAAHGRR